MHKRRLQMLAARWRRGAITVHDLRSVADELLTEGEASPALIELFSLREDAVPSEGPPLFERALQELAAQTLDEDTSSKAMAQWAADAALYGMANPETVTAIEDFVQAIPELEPAWRAHLDDYGYPLPRVFFGSDVSRFAAPLSESGDEPLQERFARAIERLAASDDPTVVKAIRVSFMTGRVGSEEAVSRLLEALPAFRPYYESEAPEPGDELLLHPVMGELARFYLEQGLAEQPDLAERYWTVVEVLAAHGDDYVKEAVHSSLIEYFAWGTKDEQAALRDAEPLQGPATSAIVAAYDEWAKRVARCTHEGTSTPDDGPPWLTRCSVCGQTWPTKTRRRRWLRRRSRG